MDLSTWASDRENNYDARILRGLLKAMGVSFRKASGLAKRAGPDFGLRWFSEQYPSFPIVLESRKLTTDVTVAQLFVGPSSRCEFWQAYHEVEQNWGNDRRFNALVVDRSADEVGDLVIHNAPETILCHDNVQLHIKGSERILVIQRLTHFYRAVTAAKLTI